MEWIDDIRFGKRDGEIPYGKCELNEFLFQNIIFYQNNGNIDFVKFTGIRKRGACKIVISLNALIGVRKEMSRLIGEIARSILIRIAKVA